MGELSVRDAYSAVAAQYVELFDAVDPDDEATDLVRRHLTGLDGLVLDLGCGPGHWTAFLHGHGVDVVGIDQVPEFLDHARTAHPGPEFRLGSLTDLLHDSVAGILAWYSTIHLDPEALGPALAGFRRVLLDDGPLVLGFFDSEDGVAAFDHKVTTAWRWPVDTMAELLEAAGFAEVERLQQQVEERPDRRYAAIAARAVRG